MMRTLSEIIESLKSGEEPTREELYYTCLALDALYIFNELDLMHLAGDPDNKFMTPMRYYEKAFDRGKLALKKSPKEWVGWNNDPHNPDYQKQRKTFKNFTENIFKKIEADKKAKGGE